jgi:hypothetical protein
MAELIHVLIVSKNQTLKRNVDEWFFSKIEAGKLKIDFSDSRKSAEEMMSSMSYDKIFHNGIYVIDAIERLQVGVDVYAFGKTNNNLNNYIENPHDKKVFSKIFSKKYLKLGVNIGGALGSVVAIVTGLVLFVAFGLYARSDIDINTEAIVKVDKKVDNLELKIDVVDDVSKENNTILKLIYGKEIETTSNKSTIGD